MILLVFLNAYDKNTLLMGKQLPDHLKGDYAKIFSRYDSQRFEKCDVKDTMKKIREYTKVFDKLVISFGLRIFPVSIYKELIDAHKESKSNLVFLKKLKGSKTWTVTDDKLSFDNYRISDTGLFVLQSKDINESKLDNFNYFIKEMIQKDKLDYKFVPYWILTNSVRLQKNKKITRRSR